MRWLAVIGALVLGCPRAPAPPPAEQASVTPAPVTFVEDIGATWACAAPPACTADYLALPDKAPSARPPPLDEAALVALLSAAQAQPPVASPQPDGALGPAIAQALGADWLIEAAGREPLVVTTTARRDDVHASTRHVLLRDPFVGTFEGILLLPPGPGPHPAVLALHGHGDDAQTFAGHYHGSGYPEAGLAILMLTARAAGFDQDEDAVARHLLRHRMSFLGVRIYEALLGLRALGALPEVDSARIGLVGHSGGAVAAALVARTAGLVPGLPAPRALVIDFVDGFTGNPTGWLLDSASPALVPLAPAIHDLGASDVPTLRAPYGMTDGGAPIWAFFRERLELSPRGP